MYKKRTLEETVKNTIEKRFITIILGARQTGKTSLLKRLKECIKYESLFIDLDIYENKKIFSSYNEVVNYLKFMGYDEKKKFILYLDEFHTVKGIDKILKNLYDHHPRLKIFATGSSSLEIVKYLKESLAGRKSIYYLYPLSFEEFVYFKDEELAEKITSKKIQKLPLLIRDKLINYVKEFCIFGGYPEVTLVPAEEDKKEVLRNIFDLFVKKDLIEFLNIKNPLAALDILKYLSLNIGNILNYSEICMVNHIDINTLKKYLDILSQTFVIKLLQPFFTNKKKEIVKAPKVYFYDTGARNYFIKNFTGFGLRNDNAFLLENFVFSQLLKKADFLTQIKYWRDKNGREVDFIVERESKIEAYEVKFKQYLKKKDLSNLIYFKQTYPDSGATVVNIERFRATSEDIRNLIYYEI